MLKQLLFALLSCSLAMSQALPAGNESTPAERPNILTTPTRTVQLNGEYYVGKSLTYWGTSDVGAQINAAYARVSANSTIHVLPPEGGGDIDFTTPIALVTPSKPVRLDLRGNVLNFTHTASDCRADGFTTGGPGNTHPCNAITINYGPVGSSMYTLGHGVFDGSIIYNGCILGHTCNLGAGAGINLLGTNAAPGPRFDNLAIGGFNIGFYIPSGNNVIWGALLSNVTLASNTTGLSCVGVYEGLTILGGRINVNDTGVNATSQCQYSITGTDIDSNKIHGIVNSGTGECHSCRFENYSGRAGGGTSPFYLLNTGTFLIDGGILYDDASSGAAVDYWIYCPTGGIVTMEHPVFYSAGRKADQVIKVNSPCSLSGSYTNANPNVLTRFYVAPFETTNIISSDSGGISRLSSLSVNGNFAVGGSNVAESLKLNSLSMSCASTTAGTFNYVAGTRGAKDVVQVCAKDANDRYAWRTIY